MISYSNIWYDECMNVTVILHDAGKHVSKSLIGNIGSHKRCRQLGTLAVKEFRIVLYIHYSHNMPPFENEGHFAFHMSVCRSPLFVQLIT